MKRRFTCALFALILAAVCALPFFAPRARAEALDEILDYSITVSVNDDATLDMLYHIDWKVLDSDSEGPLSWVRVGIPNGHYNKIEARSSTIKKIAYTSSGGHYVRIDLDREYYEGEVASFDFALEQDYMYEMNRLTEGETVYDFTPGWFDDIEVDNLTIRWNCDKVLSISPSALIRDGYYTWSTPLGEGDTYSVSVTYPNDAFSFNFEKSEVTRQEREGGGGYNGGDSEISDGAALVGLGVLIGIGYLVYRIFKSVITRAFNAAANFGASSTKKKITREKIVYYPTCQGCGAVRPEGKYTCEYCGRSFIQSKETVTEEQVP
ncbi:MAG: hypothetical protein IJM85_01735, partial [Clostridia bacterium]|nr:hypothetical protein [Clostridia bacterium]